MSEHSLGPDDGLLLRFNDADSDFSVVLDDDGRVAYAYLLEGDGIITDVWLYNCGQTPAEPEWEDRTKIPFANPQDFTSEKAVKPAQGEADVTVEWLKQDGATVGCEIYLRGELLAKLAPDVKPGWSALASKDGPLARVLA